MDHIEGEEINAQPKLVFIYILFIFWVIDVNIWSNDCKLIFNMHENHKEVAWKPIFKIKQLNLQIHDHTFWTTVSLQPYSAMVKLFVLQVFLFVYKITYRHPNQKFLSNFGPHYSILTYRGIKCDMKKFHFILRDSNPYWSPFQTITFKNIL